MALIVGRFTDRGREWLAKTLGRKHTTQGVLHFRIGEGGYAILPTLVKVPVNPSERIDKNGLVAGRGVKGDLTIDPDTAPPADKIDVSVLDVPDRNLSLFFAQKNLAPGDFTLSVDPSGVYRLEANCTLIMEEANKTFASQGGVAPKFFEIGLFADSGSSSVMVAYGTFGQETKDPAFSLINKVIFEV